MLLAPGQQAFLRVEMWTGGWAVSWWDIFFLEFKFQQGLGWWIRGFGWCILKFPIFRMKLNWCSRRMCRETIFFLYTSILTASLGPLLDACSTPLSGRGEWLQSRPALHLTLFMQVAFIHWWYNNKVFFFFFCILRLLSSLVGLSWCKVVYPPTAYSVEED